MSGINQGVATNAPSQDNDKVTGDVKIHYITYGPEKDSSWLPAIRQLISKDLSEPYSIYVYRYFLYQWGDLCFMALDDQDSLVGVIVCKLEPHRGGPMRGYIAMLATRSEYRGRGIATELVRMAVDKMIAKDADEIALETEIDNIPSLRIYENLGFLRTKRLHRYYLNGNTAFRLILYLRPGIPYKATYPPEYSYPEGDDSVPQQQGHMDEDLIQRQAAQLDIQDIDDQRFNLTGRTGD
ncbi:N-alpha-acetyltransferase 30 [Recurvomyces mirabilis]|nr:N-alpha-acetyltransferase 30 [Recurvomyces mirabilis]